MTERAAPADEQATMQATAIAHPNIALVKYWGKRDAALNLPAAGSLSLTLGPVRTETTVRFGADADRLQLNGRWAADSETRKLKRVLELVRARVARDRGAAAAADLGGAEVVSGNDFPTAAGLASSSSGFAALALAASHAAGLRLSPAELSDLSRQGSGSAARSIFGGFARMHAGTRADGTDAVAEQLHGPDHWGLRVVIAVTVEGAKEVASTDGMTLTEQTSPYFAAWIGTVEPDIARATAAIDARDFAGLARVAERSALAMHASAIAADPGVIYWRGATVDVIHHVRSLRAAGWPVFFTVDAGPHVKVFTLAERAEALANELRSVPGVIRTIAAEPAEGARLIEPGR